MGFICGIDEAGRGPLAGPVTAACVILPESFPVKTLNDSKVCTPKNRDLLSQLIQSEAIAWGLGWCSPTEIDRINILKAALTAMCRSLESVRKQLDSNLAIEYVLVDGNNLPDIDEHVFAVVKGDSIIPEIMAASILAKTARDTWMRRAAHRYPEWQFERHKGYPTKLHKQLCKQYGISPIHRKSFKISF